MAIRGPKVNEAVFKRMHKEFWGHYAIKAGEEISNEDYARAQYEDAVVLLDAAAAHLASARRDLAIARRRVRSASRHRGRGSRTTTPTTRGR